MTARQALDRQRRHVRLYLRLQVTQLRSTMEYRGDFWIGIVGATLSQLAGLLFMVAFFGQVTELGGWTAYEVALLFGLTLVPRGLIELFCDGAWTLRMQVSTGEFDRILVRPLSPAMQTATSLASIHGAGQTVLGVVVLLVSATGAGIAWTPALVVFGLVVLVSSTVMLAALSYLVNLIAFWEPSAQSTLPYAYMSMTDIARFPLEIYNTAVRVLVTVVAPFAFVSYFPALVLLDRNPSSAWLGYCSPLVTVLVVLVVRWLWGIALDRYQGVGH